MAKLTPEEAEKWMGKPYDARTFNCYHLVEQALGTPSVHAIADGVSHPTQFEYWLDAFRDWWEPVENVCDADVVLLGGGKHIGIVVCDGADVFVLHNPEPGVRLDPLALVRRFYRGEMRMLKVTA